MPGMVSGQRIRRVVNDWLADHPEVSVNQLGSTMRGDNCHKGGHEHLSRIMNGANDDMRVGTVTKLKSAMRQLSAAGG